MSGIGKMGRNPFERKGKAAKLATQPEVLTKSPDLAPSPEGPETTHGFGIFERVLVDLPAESFVFTLKLRMLVRSAVNG